MRRAVISIGVRKTGGLPELQAAVSSAQEFAKWARDDQRIPARNVKLLTDEKSVVSRERIYDAVEKITAIGSIEQLIVYFSGHGINSGLYEQWLLSRAPIDPAAAVDVKGSEFGARFCGIGHVVFISDACRTAADSIQAQRVTGAGIFPNVMPTGPERPVDQFYATLVGNPAYEVKTVAESASRFCAGYSTVLMKALRGEEPSLVETADGVGYVRPRPLKHHLAFAVPTFLNAVNAGGVTQQPDARIESDPEAWLATVPAPPVVPAPAKRGTSKRAAVGRRRMRGDETLPPPAVERALGLTTLESDAALDLRAALSPGAPPMPRKRRAPDGSRSAEVLARDVQRQRYDALVSLGKTTFGPEHMETHCGLKVRGARIGGAYARYGQTSVGSRGDAVWVELATDRLATNVLVTLADESVVVVPALRDYITGLSFDALGNLEDVWYEPSANTPRGRVYARSAEEIRRLRAIIAASTTLGVLRLGEVDQAAALLASMRDVKAMDPALAVYAAHGFNDRRLRSQIIDMQRYLDRDLGVRIFDVAMLAFTHNRPRVAAGPATVYPFFPMLTQGWALLSPLGITLSGGAIALREHLRASTWTHFTSAAADRLHQILRHGEVG